MKAKVFVFGTLFFIGNITLGANQVVQEGVTFRVENSQKRLRQNIRAELEDILRERGLEEETLRALTQTHFQERDAVSMIKIHNYLSLFQEVTYDDLMQLMATRLLFEKSIDLSRYETLVAITQTLHNGHVRPEMLEQLSHIAAMNKNLEAA